MKPIIATIAAVALLTGCNAVTKTADKTFYKPSNFSLVESTEYPVGEGHDYDAQVKADAALNDMQHTQQAGTQRPSGSAAIKHDEVETAE